MKARRGEDMVVPGQETGVGGVEEKPSRMWWIGVLVFTELD